MLVFPRPMPTLRCGIRHSSCTMQSTTRRNVLLTILYSLDQRVNSMMQVIIGL